MQAETPLDFVERLAVVDLEVVFQIVGSVLKLETTNRRCDRHALREPALPFGEH